MSSTEPSLSHSNLNASTSALLAFTSDLKMHIELTAYKDLLEIQSNLSSEPILSLYCQQLNKVEGLLRQAKMHKLSLQINFPQETSLLEEIQRDRIQYGITIRVFQETHKQGTQPMLKAILADLKKRHPNPEQNGRPVELFDFKWFVTTIKSNAIKNDIISHITSEERSPYYVKQIMTPSLSRRFSGVLNHIEGGSEIAHLQTFLDDMGLLYEIIRNPASNYQHNNKLVDGIQIKFDANQLTLFIALRLHYIARGLENPEQFVDLDNSMRNCFKSFKESRAGFFAPPKAIALKLPETPKTRYGYQQG